MDSDENNWNQTRPYILEHKSWAKIQHHVRQVLRILATIEKKCLEGLFYNRKKGLEGLFYIGEIIKDENDFKHIKGSPRL